MTINCKGNLVSLDMPLVMGIINVNTDSFYADSRHSSIDEVLFTAEKMILDGAAILDIGGQSTRPGNIAHTEEEELMAVVPVVESISKRFPDAIISIDTYRSKVAEYACQSGAAIINDISGGSFDNDMYAAAARNKAVYILMHLNGDIHTMHQHASYNNILGDITDYFIHKTAQCRQAGIHDIILDIGIGFSKTIAENYFLLKHLDHFSMFDMPLLIGLSRKSFIYKSLNTNPGNALNGTTALNFLSLTKGANILRVHDVKEAVELVKMSEYYSGKVN